MGNWVTNTYLVSRESYLVKRIKPKNQNKFVLSIELRESRLGNRIRFIVLKELEREYNTGQLFLSKKIDGDNPYLVSRESYLVL